MGLFPHIIVSVLFRATLNVFYIFEFFSHTCFLTFFIAFIAIPPHTFINAQLFFFAYFSFIVVIHNLVKCMPFLKLNAYSVAYLVPLIADLLFF